MTSRCWRTLARLLWCLWWGGLTFYAGAVVPIGTDVIGGTLQGFITQQVTHWLNGAALLAWGFSGPEILNQRKRWLLTPWWLFLVTTIGLLLLHRQLDTQLETGTHTVADPARFYRWHQAYLWVTTFQWLLGLNVLWRLMSCPASAPSKE